MSYNKKKGLICLDWDGTLLNSDQAIRSCLKKTMHTLSLPSLSEAQLDRLTGASEALITETCLGSQRHHHKMFWTLFRQHYQTLPLTLKHGALDFLERHQAFTLVIVSNKNYASVSEEIRNFKLEHMFKKIYTADMYAPKPKPSMIMSAMREQGFSPQASIMIGDSEADAQAAKQATVPFIAVHAAHWRQDYRCLNDICLYRHPSDRSAFPFSL